MEGYFLDQSKSGEGYGQNREPGQVKEYLIFLGETAKSIENEFFGERLRAKSRQCLLHIPGEEDNQNKCQDESANNYSGFFAKEMLGWWMECIITIDDICLIEVQ